MYKVDNHNGASISERSKYTLCNTLFVALNSFEMHLLEC